MNAHVFGGQQKGRRQLGFTLIEFTVAIAISVLIMVGAAALLRYMVVQTGANSNKTIAQLQVQYVGFWLTQDVVPAGNITLGDSPSGFPLTMTIPGLDGGNSTVIYDVVPNPNLPGNTWQLTRTEVDVDGQGNVTSLVAQYVDHSLTKACQGNTTYNVLVLEVAAKVDQSKLVPEADRKYQISPRLTDAFGNSTELALDPNPHNPYPCYCAETAQGAGSGE
jgi:prepilin-type N-terminal cleavage/methylation domain-containing protein